MDPDPHAQPGEIMDYGRIVHPYATGRGRFAERRIEQVTGGVHRPRMQADPVPGIVDDDIADEYAGDVLDRTLLQDLNPIQTGRSGRTGDIGSSAGGGMARDDTALRVKNDNLARKVDLDPVC